MNSAKIELGDESCWDPKDTKSLLSLAAVARAEMQILRKTQAESAPVIVDRKAQASNSSEILSSRGEASEGGEKIISSGVPSANGVHKQVTPKNEQNPNASKFHFVRCLRALVNNPEVSFWTTVTYKAVEKEAFGFSDLSKVVDAMPAAGFSTSKYESLKRQINAYGFKHAKTRRGGTVFFNQFVEFNKAGDYDNLVVLRTAHAKTDDDTKRAQGSIRRKATLAIENSLNYLRDVDVSGDSPDDSDSTGETKKRHALCTPSDQQSKVKKVRHLQAMSKEEQDREAAQRYLKAADQGEASAQCKVGLMYADGNGVTQSDNEAVRWFQMAADQGDAGAQCHLGDMYKVGRGV